MTNRFTLICSLTVLLVLASCSTQKVATTKVIPSLDIIQTPILFDEQRKQLSLEYLHKRYNIEQAEATITPKMVVVHWTVIPTLEASFRAFNPAKLPSSREKISAASSLNVSAHYLIDRDGTIYQLLPNTTFARHVIGLNHSAIGIENVGGGADLPLTNEQLQSNITLIRQLSGEFPIDYVIGHYEYSYFTKHPLWKETNPKYLTDKTDPGVEFITQIREALSDLNFKEVPGKEVSDNNDL